MGSRTPPPVVVGLAAEAGLLMLPPARGAVLRSPVRTPEAASALLLLLGTARVGVRGRLNSPSSGREGSGSVAPTARLVAATGRFLPWLATTAPVPAPVVWWLALSWAAAVDPALGSCAWLLPLPPADATGALSLWGVRAALVVVVVVVVGSLRAVLECAGCEGVVC